MPAHTGTHTHTHTHTHWQRKVNSFVLLLSFLSDNFCASQLVKNVLMLAQIFDSVLLKHCLFRLSFKAKAWFRSLAELQLCQMRVTVDSKC